jgi:hypothetical protein
MCAFMFNSSPSGKMLTRFASTLACTTAAVTLLSTTECTCRRDLKTSHRPHGRLTFCSLFAGWWCTGLQRHSVNRELPDLLQHSCACSCSKVPIGLMGIWLTSTLIFHLVLSGICTCQPRMKTSLRPLVGLTFCSLFAGRWCWCLFWHSDHLIVHHQWEHSFSCACSCSKFPIAPME